MVDSGPGVVLSGSCLRSTAFQGGFISALRSQAESAVATGALWATLTGSSGSTTTTHGPHRFPTRSSGSIDSALVRKVDEEGAATTVVRPIRVHALLGVTMPFLRLYFERPCQPRISRSFEVFDS